MPVMTDYQKNNIPYSRLTTLSEDFVKEKIDFFLSEDKSWEDITTLSTVRESVKMTAEIIAEEDCIAAGVSILPHCFPHDIVVDIKLEDGQFASKNCVLAVCTGSAQKILSRERVILNLLQRLCGIATLTKKYTEIADRFDCKILDTRKMTPGLRLFEKYAVAVGGGYNHRMNLQAAVLIKDNHISASGGVKQALNQLFKKNVTVPIELEVDNLDQLKEGLNYEIDGFLLDNMTPKEIEKAIEIVKKGSPKNVFLEASGGINLETLTAYASTGVDAISIGALTTLAKNIDLKMEFKKNPE